MKYPKQIMRKSELCEMGFPEEFLDSAYRESNQSFAQKIIHIKRTLQSYSIRKSLINGD